MATPTDPSEQTYSTLESVAQPKHGYAENLQSGNLQVSHGGDVSGPPLPDFDPQKHHAATAETSTGTKARALCGISRATLFSVLAVICILVIGGVVGGVVGGTRHRKNHISTASSSPGSAEPAASSYLTLPSGGSAPASTISSGSSSFTTTVTSSSTPSSTSTSTFSSTTWYRLTNLYLGPDIALDIVNDAGTSSNGTLQMDATRDLSGQLWQLRPSADGTTYSLCTQFLGANMRLDVPGGTIIPHLEPTAEDSGQVWMIASWGDGTWRLMNKYSGEGLSLDTYGATYVPFMDDGDHSGQHWNIEAAGSITDPSFIG